MGRMGGWGGRLLGLEGLRGALGVGWAVRVFMLGMRREACPPPSPCRLGAAGGEWGRRKEGRGPC